MQIKFYYPYIKHFFDFVFAFIMIILLSPIFLLTAFFIKISDKGPVFFTQKRVGCNFKVFDIYKFRTMVPNARDIGPVLTEQHDSRITKVGKILRRTSIDELPQILNILKGEMSFIGPRPEVPPIVATYDEEHRKVLNVRPGLSGWAQVNGRDELTIDQKAVFDLEYVSGVCFLFDLKIFFLTFPALISNKGVN